MNIESRTAPPRTVRIVGQRDSETLGDTVRAVLTNGVWLTCAQLSAGVAQFAMLAILARHLGPLAYGRWGFAAAFVTLFAAAADFGLSTLAVRDLARDSSKASRYLATAACIKALLSVMLFACMAGIAQVLVGKTETRVLIYLLGAQMLLGSGILLTNSVFRISERMHVEALLRTVQAVVTLSTIAVLVQRDTGPVGLAAAYLLITLMALCASVVIARHGFLPERAHVEGRLARTILAQSWPLAAGMIATSFYYYFDSVYMGSLGQSQQVGWYAAAYAPILWVSQIVGVVRTAFLPAQSRLRPDTEGSRSFRRIYAWVSTTLGLGAAAGGVIAARPLLALAYGSAYEPATFALQILSLTAGVMFLSSFYGSQLLVDGRQRAYFSCVAAGACVNVALNVLLIPRYSLNAAAVTTLVSESLVCVLLAMHDRLSFGLRDLLAAARMPLCGVAVLVLVATGAQAVLPAICAAGAGGAAYALVMWRFGKLEARPGGTGVDAGGIPSPVGRHPIPTPGEPEAQWPERTDGRPYGGSRQPGVGDLGRTVRRSA